MLAPPSNTPAAQPRLPPRKSRPDSRNTRWVGSACALGTLSCVAALLRPAPGAPSRHAGTLGSCAPTPPRSGTGAVSWSPSDRCRQVPDCSPQSAAREIRKRLVSSPTGSSITRTCGQRCWRSVAYWSSLSQGGTQTSRPAPIALATASRVPLRRSLPSSRSVRSGPIAPTMTTVASLTMISFRRIVRRPDHGSCGRNGETSKTRSDQSASARLSSRGSFSSSNPYASTAIVRPRG